MHGPLNVKDQTSFQKNIHKYWLTSWPIQIMPTRVFAGEFYVYGSVHHNLFF